jgi:predicted transcriptional regulator
VSMVGEVVGPAIRRMRENARVPRRILAYRAGVGETFLGDLERGERTDLRVSTLVRIVRGLASTTGRPPMEVLKYLLRDALQDANTNAPAGGGRW